MGWQVTKAGDTMTASAHRTKASCCLGGRTYNSFAIVNLTTSRVMQIQIYVWSTLLVRFGYG